ncbi:hypothetical protein NL676_032219 [Syzygium grande]|nr:hypothetical protein NL676_032219 [Syzygium grande]
MAARSVFDRMPEMVRLEAFVQVENEGSQRILEKLSVAIPHSWRHSVCIGDRSIGYVSVKPWFGDERCCASVSYAVAVEFWGRVFAMAACRMATRRMFDKMPEMVRLEATQFYLDSMMILRFMSFLFSYHCLQYVSKCTFFPN